MYSVVITTKDRLDYLFRCVKSISESTCLPYDVIIVNDGGEEVDSGKFSSFDLNIKIINNIRSRGANYCRNLGVANSEKEIVFFLDDDDSVEPDSFESRINVFELSPEIGLVYTGIKIVKSNDLDSIKRIVKPVDSINYEHDLFLKGNVIGSTSRVGVKKAYFNMVKGFDESLTCLQDYDLWISMASVCKFAHDNQSGVLYTIHDNGNQISSKYKNYLLSGTYLFDKHVKSKNNKALSDAFFSNVYTRVSLSAASTSFYLQAYYAFKSFFIKPNLKSFILMLCPKFILKKVYPFA